MPGRMIGALISGIFGAVFVIVNSAALPAVARIILSMAAVAVPTIVLIQLVRSRSQGEAVGMAPNHGRWLWPTTAVEVVAIVGGLVLLNRFTSIGWAGVAWVALVVGLHFIPFAVNLKMPTFWVLTVALSLLGVAGLILAIQGASPGLVGLVAGVLSGIALLAAAIHSAFFAQDAYAVSPAT
ncbi:MAG: hypothetical protein Q4F67_11525 [Propionibacteriaceae bacterium]|nr:hypothetical protein [Propionibacteriaceae bacterium]